MDKNKQKESSSSKSQRRGHSDKDDRKSRKRSETSDTIILRRGKRTPTPPPPPPVQSLKLWWCHHCQTGPMNWKTDDHCLNTLCLRPRHDDYCYKETHNVVPDDYPQS